MTAKKGQEKTEHLVEVLRSWQGLEEESLKSTQEIMKSTQNPVIALFMEIIHQDSAMHRRMQELIIESLTEKAISLDPEELAQMANSLSKHAEIEHETIRKAEEALEYAPHWIQKEILEYLIEDEQKHERILRRLNAFKRKLYPY